MSNVPAGALRSDDGCWWWWDGHAWQAVQAVDAGSPGDGGLLPGGAPEQRTCDLGPCPSCADSDHMSAPCVYSQGHGSEHQCAHGDRWEQADSSATPRPVAAGTPVATAMLVYDASRNQISATGNTTGWPRGTIDVVGDILCDGRLIQPQQNTCRSSTACTLPSWSTTPDPGTRWEHTVTGTGPGYHPVNDSAHVDVP